jgi:DNA-binding response OmpR family regulator
MGDVLIADQEWDRRDVLVDTFQQARYVVQTAIVGDMMLALLFQPPPHAIIINSDLKWLSGEPAAPFFIHAALANERWRSCLVIVLTAGDIPTWMPKHERLLIVPDPTPPEHLLYLLGEFLP